jgi:hypothetical protein
MGNYKEMLDYLWLTEHIQWDLALYGLFFLNLLMLFMQGDGNAFGTMLCIAVMVSCVIDKTYAFGYMLDPAPYTAEQYHSEVFIGTYLIRVAMFVGPLTIAGSTKNPKLRFIAIIAGVSGCSYMFARWYTDQRESNVKGTIGYLHLGAQSLMVTLVLVRAIAREKLAVVVDRNVPGAVFSDLAADDVEVKLA